MTRRNTDQQLTWRRLAVGLARGQVPLAMLAAAAKRSYAEICLRRGDGILPAFVPDQGEFATCLEATLVAVDHDIVIDTPAVVVLLALPDEVRSAAMSQFARVLTTDDVMVDALAAKDTLAFRSTASIGYDDRRDGLRLDEAEEAEADRLAQDAERLHDQIEALSRRTTPPSERTLDEQRAAQLNTWVSPLNLAESEQVVLWSDDPVLRALARGAGVRVTSTQAVLHRLLSAGAITAEQHEGYVRRLIKARIGNFPLNEQRLFELAEDDNWHPTGVAATLARPSTWADPGRAMAFYRRITAQVCIQAPTELGRWHYEAVRGAVILLARPQTAADIAANLLAGTIVATAADDGQVVNLLAATRQALTATDSPDQPPGEDPLPNTVTILRDAYANATSHELAARFVLDTFAALSGADKMIVVRSLLN